MIIQVAFPLTPTIAFISYVKIIYDLRVSLRIIFKNASTA
jgi:hypothetical protein